LVREISGGDPPPDGWGQALDHDVIERCVKKPLFVRLPGSGDMQCRSLSLAAVRPDDDLDIMIQSDQERLRDPKL